MTFITQGRLSFFGPATRYDLEQSHEVLYDPEWSNYDSHLLWDPLTFGVYSLREDNDSSDPTNTVVWPTLSTTLMPVMGIGDLKMGLTDAASINWDDNETYFEFAQIVTPAQMPDTNEPGEVFLRVNLHSGDADSRPVPEIGFIGVDEPFQIPFFSRPCDVDTDGDCDLTDWDLMLHALGKTDPQFDINQDGLPINNADLRMWSFYADTVDVTPPLEGDTNFDGRIDQQDLNALALNWNQPGDYGWVGGDFDGNGVADAADLNRIALRWQHGTNAAPAPVPEPGVSWLYLVLIGLAGVKRRNGRR